MVVDTAWLPDPERNSAKVAGSGGSSGPGRHHPPRQRTPELAAALRQVDGGRGVGRRAVVGGLVGVEEVVGDLVVEEEPVAQGPELGPGHLLDLVGGVAGLDLGPERPPLHRLGQDGRRCPGVLGGGQVGGVELPVVVPAPGQGLEVLVREVLDECRQPGVRAEEVLADVGARLGGVLLELAVEGGVHPVEEDAVDVLGQQLVPVAAPDDLDHVPPGPPEEGLELLDDLAVAPHRAVEPLQVAVDDERQVVEVLAAGDRQGAGGLGLVELAVAHEAPHPAVRRVGDAPGGQVAVDVGLADGVEGPEPHRHRRELPELGHEAGVGVGRQPVPAHLEAEVVELGLARGGPRRSCGRTCRARRAPGRTPGHRARAPPCPGRSG